MDKGRWWKYWNKGDSKKKSKKSPQLLAEFQERDKSGKIPYDGVIDTDPNANMTEDERLVFNRHIQVNKSKAVGKKNL